MRTITAILALALTTSTAFAGVAFFKYSYVSGMNRICVYDYLGSQVIITIPAAQVCPVNIRI